MSDKFTLNVSFLLFILLACALSIFFLFPAYDFLLFVRIHNGFTKDILAYDSVWHYVGDSFKEIISGHRPVGTYFFGLIGLILGSAFYAAYTFAHRHDMMIDHLRQELDRDIETLIKGGETQYMEFKSSFRWDMNKDEMNKALEGAVLKNIAGFMNAEGGSIIIGVDDAGTALGLEKDFQTLKTKNKDGFEMLLMTSISNKIGAPFCKYATILFYSINNKDICRVVVSKSDRPAYLNDGKDPSFFVRAGAGVRNLNIQDATNYIQSHWPSH